jgi:hypothetical protein
MSNDPESEENSSGGSQGNENENRTAEPETQDEDQVIAEADTEGWFPAFHSV